MISAAIIFDNFGPYHLARLQAASKVCDLLAIEVAGKSAVYAWENESKATTFRRTTLIQQGTSGDVSRDDLYRRLERALDQFKPRVIVVPGWASPAAWGAMTWCIRHRVPMICMSESTEWDEPRLSWKEWIKQKLLGLFSAALVGGERNRDYLVKLGLPRERIFLGYDAVDNHYFQSHSEVARAAGEKIRIQNGLPQNYFLASARFVEKKNLIRLLEAFALYRKSVPDPWDLVLLGDGGLRSALASKCEALGLSLHVLMPGFKQYGELPPYYALAGAFIHPSTIEPWGLVVNEAAASGLPLLVSNRCGCAPEMVSENINGFTFDPFNTDEMARRMGEISAPDFPRAKFGKRSEEIVTQWGPEKFAEGLSLAMQAALAKGPVVPGWLDQTILKLIRRR